MQKLRGKCINNLRTPPKFLQKPSPYFFMVHLLHRLYGVDAPGYYIATPAATIITGEATSSSTRGLDACGSQCSSTQRCAVRRRDGHVRCVPAARRPAAAGSRPTHRRAPDGHCRPGFLPAKHRRRCRGASIQTAI